MKSVVKQTGTALITVMLILVLGFALVFISQQSRTQLLDQSIYLHDKWQAAQLAKAAEYQAIDEIWQSFLIESRLHQAPPEKIIVSSNFEIEVRFEDLQGRFNLNNVRDCDICAEILNRLIQSQGGTAFTEQLEQRLSGIDSAQRSLSALLYQYSSPPYRLGLGDLVHSSEINLLAGTNSLDLGKYAEYISALPGNQPINVNSAKPQVLNALDSVVDGTQIARIREISGPYQSIDEFVVADETAGSAIDTSLVDIYSDFFGIHTRVSFNQVESNYYSRFTTAGEKVQVLDRARF